MMPANLDRHLIDHWQRELPLVPRPYQVMAERAGVDEAEVLAALSGLIANGVVARIGATVKPNTAGASTLAALSVPGERLERVAAVISAEPGVNHNYEREHALNLWFVVTGRDGAAVDAAIGRISSATDLPVVRLPLERAYMVDLGFAVDWGDGGGKGSDGAGIRRASRGRLQRHLGSGRPVSEIERRLLAGLGDGLAVTPRPFAALADSIGLEEARAIESIGDLVDSGIVSRLGLIVRHRSLGYAANAMAVWDVDDRDVDRAGERLAAEPGVSLCYRRPRRLPAWRYNLFCMVHGRERAAVLAKIRSLSQLAGVAAAPSAVLFSWRCFKQRGANLAAA